MTKKVLKKIGLALLLVPLCILLLFTFGEIFAGDMSGLSHLVQVVPLALLIFLAYKKPFIGGVILLVASLVFGILYPLAAPFSFRTIVLVESFLFVPPFVSGLLLILSSKKK